MQTLNWRLLLKGNTHLSRLCYFSSPPSTFNPIFVCWRTHPPLCCPLMTSAHYGQSRPLAADVSQARLSGSIALKASLLHLVLQLKMKVSLCSPLIFPSYLLLVSFGPFSALPPWTLQDKDTTCNNAGFVSESSAVFMTRPFPPTPSHHSLGNITRQ